MMKIINLTPHEVVLDTGFSKITFPPSGSVARIDANTERKYIEYEVAPGAILKLPIQEVPTIRVMNLPDEQPDTYFIVSSYVAQMVKRPDLLAPLTDSSAVRDSEGNIISVRAFQQFVGNPETIHVTAQSLVTND